MMKKYKIYHYNQYKGYQLITELNVRNIYDNRFWHRPVPTIGERKCKESLKKIYPWMNVDKIPVLFEDVETGRKHTQNIYKSGTIVLE